MEKDKNKSASTIARDTLISFQNTMFSSKLVGEPEELVPFSWRYPLKLDNPKKANKVLRSLLHQFKNN